MSHNRLQFRLHHIFGFVLFVGATLTYARFRASNSILILGPCCLVYFSGFVLLALIYRSPYKVSRAFIMYQGLVLALFTTWALTASNGLDRLGRVALLSMMNYPAMRLYRALLQPLPAMKFWPWEYLIWAGTMFIWWAILGVLAGFVLKWIDQTTAQKQARIQQRVNR